MAFATLLAGTYNIHCPQSVMAWSLRGTFDNHTGIQVLEEQKSLDDYTPDTDNTCHDASAALEFTLREILRNIYLASTIAAFSFGSSIQPCWIWLTECLR